jgi:hypothetical protein
MKNSDELKPVFKLWWEYLRRSEKYKKVCDWFRERMNGESENPLESNNLFFDYILHIIKIDSRIPFYLSTLLTLENVRSANYKPDKSEEFFKRAIELQFPFADELLINFFIFRDISNNAFDDYYRRARDLIYFRKKEKLFTYNELRNEADLIFDQIEERATINLGRKPKIEEYKKYLKEWFCYDPFHLYLKFFIPLLNIDEAKSYISKLVHEKQKEPRYKNKAKYYMPPNTERFQFPTGNARIKELRRYLETFDLKRAGKKNKEIAEIIYPDLDSDPQDIIRRVQRDHKKAKAIVKNVESGLFPGKY